MTLNQWRSLQDGNQQKVGQNIDLYYVKFVGGDNRRKGKALVFEAKQANDTNGVLQQLLLVRPLFNLYEQYNGNTLQKQLYSAGQLLVVAGGYLPTDNYYVYDKITSDMPQNTQGSRGAKFDWIASGIAKLFEGDLIPGIDPNNDIYKTLKKENIKQVSKLAGIGIVVLLTILLGNKFIK